MMMSAPQVIVLADDLTGAADSGVMFANHGLRTMVFWSRPARSSEDPGARAVPPTDARVISSESRECECTEAVRRVRQCVRQYLQSSGEVWIYKKIDSTLRGHPGAELAALMEEGGYTRAIVAPAFPSQGRTTIGGVHRVHGVRLDKTVFGKDGIAAEVASHFAGAFGPAGVATLPLQVIRRGGEAISDAVGATGARVIVADAETMEDLTALVRAAQRSGIRLLCGSAGLAGALGRTVDWQAPLSSPALSPPEGDLILVVAGSRHPSTRDQVLALMARGVPVTAPPSEWFTDPTSSTDAVLHDLRGQPGGSGPSVAAVTTVGLPAMPGEGSRLVRRLAQVARDLVEAGRLAGLVLTGGDTAIAVANALEAEALWLRGEVRSGVPWGVWVGGPGAGLPVVTKAGGFGEDDTLIAAVDHLRTLFR
jgi:uncharacterized protein YgbK (DUF1537 family)